MDSYSLSLTSALDGGAWSAPWPSPFTPEKDLIPTVQKTGWILGSVRTGAKSLIPPRFDLRTVQHVANSNIG